MDQAGEPARPSEPPLKVYNRKRLRHTMSTGEDDSSHCQELIRDEKEPLRILEEAPVKRKKVVPKESHKKNTAPKNMKDVYRGSLDGLVIDLKGMELNKHMVELRKTPFKHLFEAIYNGSLVESTCKRSNTTIDKIMKNYEKKTTSLKIGDKKINITEELIRLTFGIVDGDALIEIGKRERPVVEFVDRLFPDNKKKHFKLTKCRIERQLQVKEIASKDFARLAVLYVLAYALAPTQGYSIGWYYTQFVADVDKMCNYNWSLFLLDMLLAGMNKEPGGTMGCVLILAYCLCECSRIINPSRDSFVPRCVKWDLKELTKALKGKEIEDFFHKVRQHTEETEEEKRLLRSHNDEDEENDENANEPVGEEPQSALERDYEKLKLMVSEQAQKIKENKKKIKDLKNENKKLRSKACNQADRIKKKKIIIKHLEEKLANTTIAQKKLLILDINGLLANIVHYRKYDWAYTPDRKLENHVVYLRPHFEEFIDFCLENFEVALWTSRKRHNLDAFIECLLANYPFRFVWDGDACGKLGTFSSGKPIYVKEIQKVWDLYPQFDKTNTLIIDDTPYKGVKNPEGTTIFPTSFSYEKQHDDTILGEKGELRIYLKELSNATSVVDFVQKKRLGEPHLSEEDFWKNYNCYDL